MSKIHYGLIHGLSEQDKEVVRRQAESSKEFIKRLRALLEGDIEDRYIDEESDLKADPIELAISLGERRGLRAALKYIPE
jgi:hypothetical protein